MTTNTGISADNPFWSAKSPGLNTSVFVRLSTVQREALRKLAKKRKMKASDLIRLAIGRMVEEGLRE